LGRRVFVVVLPVVRQTALPTVAWHSRQFAVTVIPLGHRSTVEPSLPGDLFRHVVVVVDRVVSSAESYRRPRRRCLVVVVVIIAAGEN
jgi:hypothetical protein